MITATTGTNPFLVQNIAGQAKAEPKKQQAADKPSYLDKATSRTVEWIREAKSRDSSLLGKVARYAVLFFLTLILVPIFPLLIKGVKEFAKQEAQGNVDKNTSLTQELEKTQAQVKALKKAKPSEKNPSQGIETEVKKLRLQLAAREQIMERINLAAKVREAALNQEIAQKNQTIESDFEQFMRERKNHAETDDARKRCMQELAKSKGNCQSLEKQLQTLSTQHPNIAVLAKEKADLETRLKDSQQAVIHAEREKEVLQQVKHKKEALVKELEENRKDFQDFKAVALQNEHNLSLVHESLRKAEQQLQELQKNKKQLETELVKASEKFEKLSQQSETSKKDSQQILEKSQEDLARIRVTVVELREGLEKSEQEKQEILIEKKKLETELVKASKEIEEFSLQNETLKKQSQEDIDKIRKTAEEIRKSLEKGEQESQRLLTEKKGLEVQLKELQEKAKEDALQSALEIEKLTKANDSLFKEFQGKSEGQDKAMKGLEERLEKVSAENNLLENQLREELKTSEEETKEAEVKIKQAREEVEKVKEKLKVTTGELRGAMTEILKLRETLEGKEKQLEAKGKNIEELQKFHEENRSLIEAQRKQLEEKGQALIKLDALRRGLTEDRKGRTIKMTELENELKKSREKLLTSSNGNTTEKGSKSTDVNKEKEKKG